MKGVEASFEIITVGNELLTGGTLNTNSQWLSERITQLGGFVSRCTVIRDDVDEIAKALQESLRRDAKFVIIAGGLGPTYDDRTLEGVAKGLSRRLVVNMQALQMLKVKYKELTEKGVIEKFELTQPRVKMARLPVGGIPLPNPVGTAPGVLLRVNTSITACLPGVPAEMKGIFEDSLKQLITKVTGRVFTYLHSLILEGIVESALAPFLDRIVAQFPDVYIKSHPGGIEGKISRIRVEISGKSRRKRQSETKVMRASEKLAKLVESRGGSIAIA